MSVTMVYSNRTRSRAITIFTTCAELIYTMSDVFPVYSSRTRSRAITIFTTCAELIYTMSDVFPAAPKELLNPVIPQFVETFAVLLSTPSGQHDDTCSCVIHKEVISSLTTLLREFPKIVVGHLATVLQPIWNVVISSTIEYVRCEVNSLRGQLK
ncbi:importin-9-like isoform X1 [Dysidea avara]|uniref:importin-9-like isoform X1 n=1 Tax=Dysidea avara TaxID=196820 RepID=UPI003333BD49